MMKELRLDYPKCVLGRLLNVSARVTSHRVV